MIPLPLLTPLLIAARCAHRELFLSPRGLTFVHLKTTRRFKLCLPYNSQQVLVLTIIRIIRLIRLSALGTLVSLDVLNLDELLLSLNLHLTYNYQ